MKINAWFVPLITILSALFGIAGQPYVPLGWGIAFILIILFETFKKEGEKGK